MVVTDWGGNNDRIAALKVGSTLEMPSCNGITDKQIVEAVKAGELDESLLDEQVDILLKLIFSTRKAIESRDNRFDKYKHHLFASEIAAETTVLLKNEDNILPLKKENTVAVIGDFASNPRIQGAGSSLVNPWNPLIPLEELKKAGVNDAVLELKKYEALVRLADGKASKIIIPTDAVEAVKKNVMFSETTGLGDTTKEAKPEPNPKKPDPCCE